MFEQFINFAAINLFSILWFIFTTLFLFMAWREWRKSQQKLESLREANFSLGSIKLMNINFGDFAEELNRSNQESHRITSISYFLAGLTALFGFITSLL